MKRWAWLKLEARNAVVLFLNRCFAVLSDGIEDIFIIWIGTLQSS